MAQTKNQLPRRGLQFEGAVRVTNDGLTFRIVFAAGNVSLDFPSFPSLFRARKELSDITRLLEQLPPLPQLKVGDLFSLDRIYVAVNGRRLGYVLRDRSSYKFKFKPLHFFKKHSSNSLSKSD